MTRKTISDLAGDVLRRRAALEFAERTLQQAIMKISEQYHGAMRDLAAKLNVSVQYLSNFSHGRRSVSDEVLRKMKDGK